MLTFQIQRDRIPHDQGDGPSSTTLDAPSDQPWSEFMAVLRMQCLPCDTDDLWIVLSVGDEPTMLAVLPCRPLPAMVAPHIGQRLGDFYAEGHQPRLHLVHAGKTDAQAVYRQLAGQQVDIG